MLAAAERSLAESNARSVELAERLKPLQEEVSEAAARATESAAAAAKLAGNLAKLKVLMEDTKRKWEGQRDEVLQLQAQARESAPPPRKRARPHTTTKKGLQHGSFHFFAHSPPPRCALRPAWCSMAAQSQSPSPQVGAAFWQGIVVCAPLRKA